MATPARNAQVPPDSCGAPVFAAHEPASWVRSLRSDAATLVRSEKKADSACASFIDDI
jgi:hypothetical protein